jgi:hypothetical protein
VPRDEFLAFVAKLDLQDKEDWYLHGLREGIQTLMANPECDERATELGKALREVNKLQRSRRTPTY